MVLLLWLCCSNGNACSTASLEPEVKPPAREPSAAREAEMSVVVGGEASTEGEVPLAPAASEAAQPSDTDTVTSASLLLQSVPSTLPSPSPSAEVSGMSVHLSHSSFCVGFMSHLLTVLSA